MRILFLSDWHKSGGAAIAACRLADALTRNGHEVLWAVAHTDRTSPTVIKYTDGPLVRYAGECVAQKIGSTFGDVVRRRNLMFRIRQIIKQVRADVVNVHNIHCSELPASFPAEVSRIVPVVWTLHDMWAFTGGCSYSYECSGFTDQCMGSCPYADEHPRIGASQARVLLALRRRSLERSGRIAFVTPSQWLGDEANRGMFNAHDVRVISNGLDIQMYKPMQRRLARAALNIPDDSSVVLSVGVSVDSPRKGGMYIVDALRRMTDRRVTWVTCGDVGSVQLPDHVRHVAFDNMYDDRLLALAYNAADVHVLPTLADNLPNVLLESASCGTPSVAFDVGGVGEVVRKDVTGFLVKVGDSKELARRIEYVLGFDKDRAEAMRNSCRAFAVERFSYELQARRYIELYGRMTGIGVMKDVA